MALRKAEAVMISSLISLLAAVWIQGAAAEDKVCTGHLARIQPCIAFIEGNTSLPSSRCCRGLTYIYKHTPVCLCELLSSTGGVASTPGINVTNAVMLPTHCKVNSNTSACTTLLAEQSGSSRSSSQFFGLASLTAAFVPSCIAGLLLFFAD